MGSTTEPAKPRRADLERYCEIRRQRTELDRQSRNLQREEKLLLDRIEPYARAQIARAKTESCLLLGCLIKLVRSAGRVDWKSAFVGVAGADEATRLMHEAPPTERLVIEPVS